MKNLLILMVGLLLLSSRCKKTDDSAPGAITYGDSFSCKVNGKVFIPQKTGRFNGLIPLEITYNRNSGRYDLNIIAYDFVSDIHTAILIQSKSIELKTGVKVALGKYGIANAGAQYEFSSTALGGAFKNADIISPLSGELTISNNDAATGVLTGTFWFDAVDDAGNKYEIRDGKFSL